ncbi:MAG: transcription elongation factor Spt5 [Candidatus Aenigmarchaeota archaeon]|nr:transcription elongation factor Spt5 [Candidatus Aenigmarchaeota archaeon]
MIYTIRTTSGREDIVIDILTTRLRSEGYNIKAIFHPAEIKGYVFVEGSAGDIHKAIHGMMHVRGVIEKPIKLSDIQHFLEVNKDRIKIDTGDIVEIIGGPFKGERGKIQRIDKVKDEATIELLEASIPIPVTISTEFVKVVKKQKKEEEEVKEQHIERKEESKESVFDNISSDSDDEEE